MTDHQTHAQDCAEILREQHAAGRLDRRTFLAGLGALGLAPALAGRAKAQTSELVISNWGGDAVRYFGEAFGGAVKAETGLDLVVDGGGPSMGKIRTMVEANNTIWDLCDSGAGDSIELGALGMLEPIDYSIVPKSGLIEEFAYDYGCPNYTFGVVLAYDKEFYGDTPPTKMADFWDTENFKGRRMLRRRGLAMLEMALIADGVPFDQMYPLDVDRALAKIKPLAKDALFWNNGTESQQLMREGECQMGLMWHTRANLLNKETDGRITWTFNEGVLFPGIWVVPKNNPAGAEAAMKAIAAMQDPEAQIALLGLMGNGPSNPAAAPLIPEALKHVDPGLAADRMLKNDGAWWGANVTAVEEAYSTMIAS
ncbi:MAG: extracellular solute-binding protein [Pseudomonadota bacterium]|nr:extracellular solute-binding protein [Pseudomonadota bacterium]